MCSIKSMDIHKKLPVIYKVVIFIPIIIFLVFGNLRGTIWLLNDLCIMYMLYISANVKIRYSKSLFFVGLFLLMCIIGNVFINGLYSITLIRIYDIFKGIVYLRFINYLTINYKNQVMNFVSNDLFYFFNIYFIINIPIFLNQIKSNINRDNIAGMVGFHGTHVVLLVWVLIIVINCAKLKESEKITKIFLLLIFEFVFMLILGVFSDNTAFYFLGTFILIYSLSRIDKISRLFTLRNISIIILSAIVIINFIESNEKVKFYIDTKIKVKIEQYTNLHNDEIKSEERVEMIQYGLSNGNGFYFGKGIGIRYDIFGVRGKEYNEEPLHINMCDTSALIYEGGLIFAILVISLYYIQCININRNNKIFIFIITVLFFCYAKLISDEKMVFVFSLIQLALYYSYNINETN